MTKNIEKLWSALKETVENDKEVQVVYLNNGGKVVYYPPNSGKRVKKKTFTLRSPSGAVITGNNINAFCKDIFGETEGGRGRYSSSFSDMFNGIRAADNVEGWEVYRKEG